MFFFADEAFLNNYAHDTALYSVKKTTSLTNLSYVSTEYRNGSMIIIWS